MEESVLCEWNEGDIFFKKSSTYKLKMHQEHFKYEFQLCDVFLVL